MKIADKISEIKDIPGTIVWVASTGLVEGIVLRGSIPGGRSDAPHNHREIAAVTAELFDEGTLHRNREELRELLLGLGANIDFRTRATRIEFTVTCLSSGFEAVVKLIAEMLYEPLFSNTSLKAVSARLVGQLTEVKFDPTVQAQDTLSRILYPSDSPLHRREFELQLKGLKNASRSAVIAHHKKILQSGDFHLVVAGDITPLRVEKVLKQYFKSVDRSLPMKVGVPTKTMEKRGDSFLIQTIPDKASVDTLWGGVPGISKLHPDFIPLTVALQILGGGFMSRLMQEIREKRGLTYGIYTRFSGFETGLLGYWYIGATFAPQVFKEGVVQVERVLEEFISVGVTHGEVAAKKGRMMGLHKISCSSTEEISSVLLALLDDGRPFSYVDQLLSEIEAVTLDDVNTIIVKYFSKTNIARAAAGSINQKGLPLTGKALPARL